MSTQPITTAEPAERFADLSRTRWKVVARRHKSGHIWQYEWPEADTKAWERAKFDGTVLVCQRDAGAWWVALGRVA